MIARRTIHLAIAILLLGLQHSFASEGYRTIVLSDAPPPVDGAGFVVSMGLPVINARGDVAFSGLVQMEDNDPRFRAMLTDRNGVIGLAAIEGNEIAGAPDDARFERTGSRATINRLGQLAFAAGLTNTGGTNDSDEAILLSTQGALSLAARYGEPAPSTTPLHNFIGFDPPVLNGFGESAFKASLLRDGLFTGPDNQGVFVKARDGSLNKVARESEPIVHGSAELSIDFLGTPVLSDSGQATFLARFVGPGVDTFNDTGILTGSNPDDLQFVVRAGDPAPHPIVANVRFEDLSNPGTNAHGHVVFHSDLRGSGLGSNTEGIFTNRNGDELELVARRGESAPSASSFTTFEQPVINNQNHIAFRSFLSQSGVSGVSHGIFKDSGFGTDLVMVALYGEQAPGTEPDTVFVDLADPTLNNAGQTAFLGAVFGNDTTRRGIWAEDPDGNLTLIALLGDVLDVSDDPLAPDLRTIDSLGFVGADFAGNNIFKRNSGNADGFPSAFSDRGELAFYAEFTDGSRGVFVSTLTAVPEPTSMMLLALLTTCLCRRLHH